MSKVSEILEGKGRDVLEIGADASVLDAVRLMVERNVGSLLVTDEGGEVAGIVTERDYLRRVTLEGRAEAETRVAEVMSSPLVVTPEPSIDECMAIMSDRRIRHLPVVDEGRVAGLVSIGDLVKFRSRQQSFEIQYLTNYITTAG